MAYGSEIKTGDIIVSVSDTRTYYFFVVKIEEVPLDATEPYEFLNIDLWDMRAQRAVTVPIELARDYPALTIVSSL